MPAIGSRLNEAFGMYTRIRERAEFDRFCDVVDRLHDGLLREVAIVSRGHVDAELGMWGDVDPFDMRVLIQLQQADVPCIELLLRGVSVFRIVPTATTFEPEADFVEGRVILYLQGRAHQGSSLIVAKEFKYCIRSSDCLGQSVHLIRPFPEE